MYFVLVYYFKALRVALHGDYLNKIHRTSTGKAKKFIKLCSDGCIKWANKESDINNPKKYAISNTNIN